jgi:hypothetical protein
MRPLRFVVFACILASLPLWSQSAFRPDIPKVWDESALADWATPVAGLKVRPTHMAESVYYALPTRKCATSWSC